MDNKELAHELIVRYAGLPLPMRGMIQEAARRLLQMVPDEKTMAGASEADSLRQLAAEWPVTNKPSFITSDDWLRCVCTGAADRIEQMAETIDYARTIQAEGVRLKAELEKVTAERDAAIASIRKIAECGTTWMCPYCKNAKRIYSGCCDCALGGVCRMPFTKFEWRGGKLEDNYYG